MRKQFVTYEIALKLKELGFNEECLLVYNSYKVLKHIISGTNPDIDDYISFNKYDDRLPAPLWQQAIEWFREKHSLHISIYPVLNHWEGDVRDCNLSNKVHTTKHNHEMLAKTYHSIRNILVLKAIEILTEQNQNK